MAKTLSTDNYLQITQLMQAHAAGWRAGMSGFLLLEHRQLLLRWHRCVLKDTTIFTLTSIGQLNMFVLFPDKNSKRATKLIRPQRPSEDVIGRKSLPVLLLGSHVLAGFAWTKQVDTHEPFWVNRKDFKTVLFTMWFNISINGKREEIRAFLSLALAHNDYLSAG